MALSRPCTVTAHVPPGLGAVDRKLFLDSLLEDIPKEELKCVQELRGYFRVTFKTPARKEKFVDEGLAISGISIPIQEADEFRLVRLHNVPFEVPEGEIKVILSRYGDIRSHRFELDRSGVCTSTRLVRMSLRKDIPNNLSVLGYPFVAWYPGQPKLCRVCQAPGHIASRCPNKGLCRVCRSPGHFAKSCPNGPSDPSSNPWRRESRASTEASLVAGSSADRPGARDAAAANTVNLIEAGIDAELEAAFSVPMDTSPQELVGKEQPVGAQDAVGNERPAGAQESVGNEQPVGAQAVVFEQPAGSQALGDTVPVVSGIEQPTGSQELAVDSQALLIAASDAETAAGLRPGPILADAAPNSVSSLVEDIAAIESSNYWDVLSEKTVDLFGEVSDVSDYESSDEINEDTRKKQCAVAVVPAQASPVTTAPKSNVTFVASTSGTDADGFRTVRAR